MTESPRLRLDIVIPVYNEGANIVTTLRAIARDVKTPYRVLICYDHEDDDTLPAITQNRGVLGGMAIEFVSFRMPRRFITAARRAACLCGSKT